MKSAIVYYSYSGNTRNVAEFLRGYLSQKGGVDAVGLKPLDEPSAFFGQCVHALRHKRAVISEVGLDLAGYALICIGTPVWAFGPAPAVNTYLDKCQGIKDKGVILFTTYGSGTGNQRCLDYMKSILAKKGARDFKQFSIQQGKTSNEAFVISKIKGILPL
jgi:flavodoxin